MLGLFSRKQLNFLRFRPQLDMAEGDFYTMGNRQRFPRDPFGESPFREQSPFRDQLGPRFMEDEFGMPPFPDDLAMDWPGWARPDWVRAGSAAVGRARLGSVEPV